MVMSLAEKFRFDKSDVMPRIMMLLAKARNDVMFARYAVRRNIIHTVNITDEVNITCP